MLNPAGNAAEKLLERLQKARVSAGKKPFSGNHLARLLSPEQKARDIKGRYHLSPETIAAHVDEILLVEEEQAKCKGCIGICAKTGSSAGMIPRVKDDDGLFYTELKPCRYARGQQISARIERLCLAAKVPARYKDKDFTDYDVTDENRLAVNMAGMMVKAEQGGIFLHGAKGTGKTMLAAIIANERAKSGKAVLFASVPDLLRDIRATFDGGNPETVTRAVQNAPLLVLDDLGAEKMTSWVGEALFRIINHRYNENLPTVITSNYSGGMLVEHLRDPDTGDTTNGERIVSRIGGWCLPVKMGGKDRREGQTAKIYLFSPQPESGATPGIERL